SSLTYGDYGVSGRGRVECVKVGHRDSARLRPRRPPVRGPQSHAKVAGHPASIPSSEDDRVKRLTGGPEVSIAFARFQPPAPTPVRRWFAGVRWRGRDERKDESAEPKKQGDPNYDGGEEPFHGSCESPEQRAGGIRSPLMATPLPELRSCNAL